MNCQPMDPDEQGWSEWIHPVQRGLNEGYLMQCCDCGLIHEMQFEVGARNGDGPLNPGETKDAVIIFRARRWPTDGDGFDPTIISQLIDRGQAEVETHGR